MFIRIFCRGILIIIFYVLGKVPYYYSFYSYNIYTYTGVSNNAALNAKHFLRSLHCACCVVDCAPQVGNCAAGLFSTNFIIG